MRGFGRNGVVLFPVTVCRRDFDLLCVLQPLPRERGLSIRDPRQRQVWALRLPMSVQLPLAMTMYAQDQLYNNVTIGDLPCYLSEQVTMKPLTLAATSNSTLS